VMTHQKDSIIGERDCHAILLGLSSDGAFLCADETGDGRRKRVQEVGLSQNMVVPPGFGSTNAFALANSV
jgi:hypothetical protein